MQRKTAQTSGGPLVISARSRLEQSNRLQVTSSEKPQRHVGDRFRPPEIRRGHPWSFSPSVFVRTASVNETFGMRLILETRAPSAKNWLVSLQTFDEVKIGKQPPVAVNVGSAVGRGKNRANKFNSGWIGRHEFSPE